MTEWSPELKRQVEQMIRQGHDSTSIAKVIGKTKSAVLGAKSRNGWGSISRAGVIPEGFAEDWPLHSIRELAKKYEVGRATPTRWASKLGLPLKVRNLHRSVEAKPRKQKPVWRYVGPVPKDRYVPDDSETGLAQRELQRYASCYRCNEEGQANVGGKFWRYGRLVLTSAELIERAAIMRQRRAA